jgi:hypothetical protein
LRLEDLNLKASAIKLHDFSGTEAKVSGEQQGIVGL